MIGKITLVTEADGGLSTKTLLDAGFAVVGLFKDLTGAAIPIYGRGL